MPYLFLALVLINALVFGSFIFNNYQDSNSHVNKKTESHLLSENDIRSIKN